MVLSDIFPLTDSHVFSNQCYQWTWESTNYLTKYSKPWHWIIILQHCNYCNRYVFFVFCNSDRRGFCHGLPWSGIQPGHAAWQNWIFTCQGTIVYWHRTIPPTFHGTLFWRRWTSTLVYTYVYPSALATRTGSELTWVNRIWNTLSSVRQSRLRCCWLVVGKGMHAKTKTKVSEDQAQQLIVLSQAVCTLISLFHLCVASW